MELLPAPPLMASIPAGRRPACRCRRAEQRIVARPAVQDIGNAIANEGVVEIRARQVLEIEEGVGAGANGILCRGQGRG